MIYYYAQTGHKIGLDRARRGTAVVKALREAGVEATLLANDFRAGVAMKELGLHDYITVETVLDVDAVATEEDAVIIDTAEDDKGKIALYVERFACLGRFVADDGAAYADELLLKERCAGDGCTDAVIVDQAYFTDTPKEERILFFFGDADYDKTVLAHEAFFQKVPMDLLWGHYFFVKYEDALAKLFRTLYESEEYEKLITSSATVVTASSQTALEAKASGAKTVYIVHETTPCYDVETLRRYGVEVIDGFDAEALQTALQAKSSNKCESLHPFCADRLLKKCK